MCDMHLVFSAEFVGCSEELVEFGGVLAELDPVVPDLVRVHQEFLQNLWVRLSDLDLELILQGHQGEIVSQLGEKQSVCVAQIFPKR